jgi:hypothetical protein
MMMSCVITFVIMMTPVSAALWLKRRLYFSKICAKAKQHVLDHVVRANSKYAVSNFCRQMTVTQKPGQARKLIRILMRDFDNIFGLRLNSEPPSIFQLQTIPVCHSNRLRKIEKDVFTLIRCQPNAAPMARVEVQRERT